MSAFALNQADLEFVLKQIKIAEAHANGIPLTSILLDLSGEVITNPLDPAYIQDGTFAAVNPNQPLAIPDPLTPFGLRTVDGTYNNLIAGRETWGAADTVMPRALDPNFRNDADGDLMPLGPPGAPVVINNNYAIPGAPTGFANGGNAANVADADPRIISNLVVDMSVNNPAAIQAWFSNALAVAAWEEAHPGMTPVAPGEATGPNDLELTNADLASIPNIAPDEGLSASFNAWMTFFGQFFDHGLDLISKGGNGTVYIPLQADDPLVTHGPDGVAGSGDEVPPEMQFMVLTRATDVNSAAPGNEARNTTTAFVDQNQTYTSHASHQVFLREYATVGGRTVSTGHLLDGTNNGLPTWADIKLQARNMLGIELTDRDVLNIPLIRTDAYGNFIPDPTTGYAQLVIGIGTDGIPNTADDIVVSGTPAAPVNTFSATNGVLVGAVRIGHAFLDDLAHNANPGGVFDPDGPTVRDSDGGIISGSLGDVAVQADEDSATGNLIGTDHRGRNVAYDDELLNRHFITGDGRGNENIGLTTVHHIFHSEHNRQIEAQKLTVLQSGDLDFINEWLLTDLPSGAVLPTTAAEAQAMAATLNWDGERLFQAGRFATEMQYQHLVFEEFARKIQPNIDPFVFNTTTDINPSIFAEFAHTVYRFGHSMLTDNMPRINADGTPLDYLGDQGNMGLITAFLNPVAFDNNGAISADQAAGAIVRGMTIERGNEIDEFIVGSLRNNLLGLPLDLATINIARGRDTGVPSLNDAREQLYAATGSTFLKPYDNWVDFAANLKNSISVINFIAAYGRHESILEDGTLAQKREAAALLVLGGDGAPEDRIDYLTSTGTWANRETGLNEIDLWIGGLAEKKMPFGGMLGSTFNAIFEAQMENLQDGDRFYYLTRTQGQNLLVSLEQNSFAKLIMANTDLSQPGADGIRGSGDDIIERHIGVDSFATYDFVLEVDPTKQADYDPDNLSATGVDPVGADPILEALGLGRLVRNDPGTAGPDANYIRFTGGEHIVVGGTNNNDTIITDFGDDGIWGDAGDDRIESGAGVDLVNGGAGNDIITDSGDTGDFLKGDEGDDVIANSNGLDILMGGLGKDVFFVGVDDTEVFAGQGDDFILGGDGVDLLMGNEGDDWIEGGAGFDTTAGDNSELFFNSTIIGHDVLFAGTDENDFDGESGDDIMVQGESVNRSEGMFGFDWGIFKGMERDAHADLEIPIFTTEQADILRNRFDKVEALSGWENNDTLIGDDRVFTPSLPGDITATTEGTFFNDGLDQAGINRIAGLGQIVSVNAATENTFQSGNILLGGAGNDVLQGNAGDDILDGDRWLNVRIRITNPDNPATAGVDETTINTQTNELTTVDSLKHIFTQQQVTAEGLPAAWAGQSLFQLTISRTVVPSQLHIVREILTDGAAAADTDVAVFSDNRVNYTITTVGNVTTVAHTGFGTATSIVTRDDGVDTLRNIERLRFADIEIGINRPAAGAPIISDLTPTEGQQLSANTGSITDPNGLGAFSFQWQSLNGATWTNIAGATNSLFTPQDLPLGLAGAQAGLQLRVAVSFIDGGGNLETVFSSPTGPVGRDWDAAASATFNGTAGDDIADGSSGVTLPIVGQIGGVDVLNGNAGDDILNGNGGTDTLNGGAGNDRISGGAQNDLIIQSSIEGRDFVDGGVNTDTYQLNGIAAAETFGIHAVIGAANTAVRSALQASLGTTFAAATEIVITRTVGAVTTVVAELDNIEEISVNALNVTANDGGGLNTVGSGDTITISGNFSTTSLNFSTITVNGNTGNDVVDITSLQSAHRIVFRSNGGDDTVIGTLRPQDVIELRPGSSLEDYTASVNGNGTTTYSDGTNSITFSSAGTPVIRETQPPAGNDEGVSGAFEYTPNDIAGLKALVNGQQPPLSGDEDVPLGVRNLSGHGNNIANPDWGSADEPFIRITNPHYGAPDAQGNRAINPLFSGLDPRNISNIIGTQEAGLPHAGNDANIFFMAMGQYIDHGLDFLGKGGNGSIQIGAPGNGAPGSGNPADLTRGTVSGYDANGVPQHINHTSPFVDQNQAYGSNDLVGQFLREGDGQGGVGSRLLQGSVDPSNGEFRLLPTLRELIEHHWENNTVFHSDSLQGGQVAFQTYFAGLVTGGAVNSAMLPGMINSFMGSGHALLLDTNPYINVLDHYVAGDGRANENFALTSIHTIWARNHNFHVENLRAAGFEGSEEELFQAAKIINEAEYQRVVFDEYADTLLGGLRGQNATHGFQGYDPAVNPGISHEFAGAVFRFGHSLIGQSMTILDANGNPTQVSLFDAFLNPSNDPDVFTLPIPTLNQFGYFPQPGYEQHGVNAVVGGIISQPAEDVDFNIVDAVRNDLVRINADLFAFNQARGWDLGLGSLNQVRRDLANSTDPHVMESVGYAGDLSPYTSWEDFQARNGLSTTVINQFKQAFPDLILAANDIAAFRQINPDIPIALQADGTGVVSGIERVDLWLGGLAEKHINGGVVGQTYWVVLHDQFDRLQDGDRFYYVERLDDFDFYEQFIDGQEFADIVARNTGMTDLPEHMFRTNEIDDQDNDDQDDDDDDVGNDDDAGNNDDDGNDDDDTGNDDDDADDDEDDDDDAGNDDDDTDDGDNDTDDDVVTPPPSGSGSVRTGTPLADVLVGTAGDDSIIAFAGDDVAVGDAGADNISAGEGADFVNGGDGNDNIFAGDGNDQIFGGAGADVIFGDAGADRIFGDSGNDAITAGAGNDTVFGGAGNDLFMAEVNDGDDVYFGDSSDGGVGIDMLDMSAATAAITVNLGVGLLGNGTATGAQIGNDTIWGIENVNTGSGNDTIIASNAVNVMSGGAGNDIFRFNTAAAADGDTVLGFQVGDRLDFSGIDADTGTAGDQAFTAIIPSGPFTAAGQLAVSLVSRDDGDFTVIQGNINGDPGMDFRLEVEGHHTISAANTNL